VNSEHDGVHEAVEHFVKEGIGLAIQVAAHLRNLNAKRTSDAERLDRSREIERLELAKVASQQEAIAKLELAHARTRWQGVGDESWWQTRLTEPGGATEIVDTYRDALTHQASDVTAGAAVITMNEGFKHPPFGFDVDTLTTSTVPEADVQSRYAEHLTKDPTNLKVMQQLNVERSVRKGGEKLELADDLSRSQGLDHQAARVLAGVSDLHLSQAMTAVSNTGTIADVAAMAEEGERQPNARRERAGVTVGSEREQER
jgi:hypothetical protein